MKLRSKARLTLLSLLRIYVDTPLDHIIYMQVNQFQLSKEALNKKWKKEKYSPLRLSDQLESNNIVFNQLFRGQVGDDVDCSHYMKDYYAD